MIDDSNTGFTPEIKQLTRIISKNWQQKGFTEENLDFVFLMIPGVLSLRIFNAMYDYTFYDRKSQFHISSKVGSQPGDNTWPLQFS